MRTMMDPLSSVRRLALCTLGLAVLVAGCGREAESGDDLEESVAVEETAETEAAASDEARAPAEAAPSEAPTGSAEPATEATASAQIPAGTNLVFEVRERVTTGSHEAGDSFSLVLVDEVRGTNGARLPAGAQARGVVTESRASSSSDEEAVLAVRAGSVEVDGTQRMVEGTVEGAEIRGSTRDSGTRTAAKVATGAAAGAMIGQILGGDTRSTVQGAAVGTAAGVGVALSTRDGHAELAEGSRIVVRLDRPLEL